MELILFTIVMVLSFGLLCAWVRIRYNYLRSTRQKKNIADANIKLNIGRLE